MLLTALFAGLLAFPNPQAKCEEACTHARLEAVSTTQVVHTSSVLAERPCVPVNQSGALAGRVTYSGKRPQSKPLVIGEANAAGCTSDGSKVNAENLRLLVHEDGGIANAVVTIEVEGQQAKPTEKPIVLDQMQCRFLKHVVIVPVGAQVEYKNSDDIAHNVHVICKRNRPFNRTLPARTSYTQHIQRAEALQVTCDIHPWMRSYVYATTTPFYALTDKHGAFRIAGLPPGTHKTKVWHETLGELKGQVTVQPGAETQPLDFSMSPKKRRRK